MARYEGSIFGFNYSKDFDTDDEFATWLISKLKVQIPIAVFEKIVTRLIQQSDEYQLAKSKIVDHEARIKALEAKAGV